MAQVRGKPVGHKHGLTLGRIGAFVGGMLCVSIAGLAALGPDNAKINPSTVTVQPAPTLPPEVQMLETRTAPLAFDRDTGSEHTAYDSSQIIATLAAPTEVRGIKLFGAAPYSLSVQAEVNGGWQPLAGLQNLNLSALSDTWHSYTASTPVTAARLRFDLVMVAGGTSTGLKAIEIWGSGSRVNIRDGRALLDALRSTTPPTHARLYTAALTQGVIGGVADDPADNEFVFVVNDDGRRFKRAYLAYEVLGLPHWAAALRAINGHPYQGGFLLPAATDWSTQIEVINPDWLMSGANTVSFAAPPGATGSYTIRNAYLIAEYESGGNFVRSVADNRADPANPARAIMDGDINSGWTPYTIGAVKADAPTLTLSFDKPTQLDGLTVYLVNALKGTVNVEFLSAGVWSSSGAAAVDGRKLAAGWNNIAAPSSVAVDGVRLVFSGGQGSSAEIKEVVPAGAGVGPAWNPARFTLSYPDAGQYYGRSAYLRGFLQPPANASGNAAIFVGGREVPHTDGAFGVTVSKDDVGLSAQGNSEAWSVEVKAVYPDGVTVIENVALDQYLAAVESTAGNLLPGYNVAIAPGQAKKIDYDAARLEVPADALAVDTTVGITPLGDTDLAALDTGMTNVTKGPRKGYRFTPHPMKFKTKVKVTLPYQKSLIPPGLTEQDIKTFYFDDESGSWKELERAAVDTQAQTVTSLTDHFTDMINATVTVPDHPQTVSFNPTQIKDIKAADPGAQINLIEPPRANNMGDARLSYPIEIPPGRQGLQPDLALQYNSGGGNGWLGMGWDLPMQSISVDTRWGVPRYHAGEESETYLLNGEQLTPVAHRSEPVARSAEKVFHTRVEGQFRRIVRHGTAPDNYWWEVTDKNGVRYIYGGDPVSGLPTADSTLTDDANHVFLWSLREIRDTNDNFVRYRCVRQSDPGVQGGTVPGINLYVREITYSGHGTEDGPYRVTFRRDRELGEALRVDRQIDGRGRFKRVTADLLRQIDVSLGTQLIRRYEFKYNENAYGDGRPGTAFFKTLLTSVTQRDTDGKAFNTHTFSYHDEIRDQTGSYRGFAQAQDWSVPSDNVTGNLIGGNDRASALGGSETRGAGGHLYVGFNIATGDKKFSIGAKVGYQRGRNTGRLQLLDINGDGLPDKVVEQGGVVFRPNLFNTGQTGFGGTPAPAVNLSDLSREDTESTTFGGEAYFGASVFADRIDSFSTASKYISDVNGDGLPDLVNGGGVLFNGYQGSGDVVYTANSNDTPYPIGSGAVQTAGLLDDFTEIYEARIDQFPLMDAVLRWTAPYSGQIRITAPVALIEDTSADRSEYRTADGVRVAIQHENSELWATEFGPTDYVTKTPTGVDSITVTKGERIYFRVQSKFDGAYDRVSWNPVMEYLSVAPAVDVNNLNARRFEHAQDFVLTGRPSDIRVPLNGVVRIGGLLTKTGVTSDDIAAQVIKNGAVIASRQLRWDQTGTIDFGDLDIPVAVAGSVGDQLALRVRVDSEIDATRIQWAPEVYYVSSPDAPVLDQNGNYQIKVMSPYDMDLYPRTNMNAPQATWTAPQTGTLTVLPTLAAAGGGASSGAVILTIKKKNELVSKHVITVNADGTIIVPPVTQAVTAGDELYFDLSARDPYLYDRITNASISVTFGDPATDPLETVPSALRGNEPAAAFPVRYRGWAATAYNGNRDRATQPIEQAALVVDEHYTLENARVYPLAPIPNELRWRGQDDNNWVAAGALSSSRLGIDYIQVPSADGFAGARAVNRIGRSRETSIGAGVFGASYSRTENAYSNSELEFIDLNGDRFPDIIGNGVVQYTTPVGGLEPANAPVPGLSKIRRSATFAETLGIGGNPASDKSDSSGGTAPKGGGGGTAQKVSVFIVKSDMPSIGFSANTSRSESNPEFDLMDVNGDGLPDRVIQAGSGLSAQLNLGYKFAAPEPWGNATISDGESSGLSGGLGYNDSVYGWAGGLNLGRNDTRTNATLVDINGDGLLDRVEPAGAALKVWFNLGGHFADDFVTWPGAIRNDIQTSTSDTQGGGVYFTIGIGPLCLAACYVIINPGVNLSVGMGRQEVSIQDIDGDGYPDHLFSERDDALKVASNRTGRTNLLKTVTRPLGGRFDLAYSRSGNSYDQPQNRWVLSQVTVFDGVANDHPGNGADYQVSQFGYESGKWDRLERDFFGFARVTETHLNTVGLNATTLDSATPYRRITRDFLRTNFYNKGLITREYTEDVQNGVNRPFLETLNTYLLRDIDTGNEVAPGALSTATVFPELARTDRRFYEGGTVARKSTYTTHTYDTLGNIIRFVDAGDAGAQDDVEALINYSAADANCQASYIVGKANSIDVIGAGQLMRRRTAGINCATGNVDDVTQYLESGEAAVTDLTYFTNGNLKTVTGPANQTGQRYQLTYEYDPVVATHVTRITDSFGYSSQATHNYLFGKPEVTTDINHQQTTYAYDQAGRVDTITGPYEQGSGQVTIRFDYHPEALIPYALTQHVDQDAAGGLKDPIETLLYTDGLKRVLQTKKDAALHTTPDGTPAEAMIVSGRIIFDQVGRVVEQYYPTTEPKGANTAFNTGYDSVTPTRMVYDVLDRNLKTTLPDGTNTRIDYGFGPDRAGALQFETVVTDANAVQKRTYRDVRELITAVKEFNQGETLWTSYAYDPLKQIVQVADDRNNLTRIGYDHFGRRTAIDNPDLGLTETRYDLASNVIAKVTANLRAAAKQITYNYDFNRLVAIHYPDFTGNNVAYTYGAPGAADNSANRIVKVTSQAGTEERAYGPLGELTRQTWTLNSATEGNSTNSPEVYTTAYQYDTWNRMLRLTYPDGEVLTYQYDSGGLVQSAQGVKSGYTYDYVKRLEYDKFEQRAFLEAGNNVRTAYTYDPLDRRLCGLITAKGLGAVPSDCPTVGSGASTHALQALAYHYDDVGNILGLDNQIPVPPPSQYGGPTAQRFHYDDLYRLTHAEGSYQFNPDKRRSYSLDLAYDTIHNLRSKNQSDIITEPSGTPIVQKKTSYLFQYDYGLSRPHAPTHIGDRTYSYDANGNQLGWEHDQNGTRRTLVWDEENRLQSIFDNGHEKTYHYDDQGQRIIKRGPRGETAYINQYFTIRNREIGTKHIYLGTTRAVSKLMKQDKPGANPSGKTPYEKDLYFYHPDHLGSSNAITDTQGQLYEHLEYFPFGETWVEESSNTQRTPYLFTGKELDEETGLYYFGARYYDPRTSVWQSGDPLLGKYFPTGNPDKDRHLPGVGGVYNSLNLGLYGYGHQNPVRYTDPDGQFVGKVATEVGKRTAIGWAGALVEPTPAGEIVMAVITVGVTAYTIYEVATAPQEKSTARTTTTATTTTKKRDEGGIPLFHGTDKQSALLLAAGAPIDVEAATRLKHSEGATGFYLATHPDAAQYFASRAGTDAGIVTYMLSSKAVTSLTSAGARFEPVPPGGIQRAGIIPGEQLYIPPNLFPMFNTLLRAGEIRPVAVSTTE